MNKMDCYTADSKQENSERDEERVEQDDELERASTTRRNVGENHLTLCHRVTLDSAAHWWVPARTPTVHRCPKGKALGGPTQASQRRTTDKRQHDTDKSQDKCAFISKCRHALGILHGGGAGSRSRRFTREMLSNFVNEHVVNESTWRRPGSSRRSRREAEPVTQEKITQEKINPETEYIQVPQNQYTDKVVGASVAIQ